MAPLGHRPVQEKLDATNVNELHVEGYGPDKGHLPLSKLRHAGDVVELHAVGITTTFQNPFWPVTQIDPTRDH